MGVGWGVGPVIVRGGTSGSRRGGVVGEAAELAVAAGVGDEGLVQVLGPEVGPEESR